MSRLEVENNGNGKEYKVKAIHNNAVYAKELEDYLPGFYYLVFRKAI